MSECVSEVFLLNGEVKEKASFPDTAFTKGKSLYEVIRIMDGIPLFWERHWARLERSATLLHFNLLGSCEVIRSQMAEIVEFNKQKEGNIKIVFDYELNPSIYVYFIAHHYPSDEEYRLGVTTILYHAERENPNAKVINQTLRQKVDAAMKEASAYEAILVDREGYITEGSRSNLFFVQEGKIITAPGELVLPGITREVIIEVCDSLSIEVMERRVHHGEIEQMEALFISGTSPRVLPVSKVDQRGFSSPQNPTLLAVMRGYNERIEAYLKEHSKK